MLKTMVILGTLWIAGCATPSLPAPTAEAPRPEPSPSSAALKAQARELRTHITHRKQKIAVFEVMLTDVERRAARSQVSLSYLPNTNLLPEVETVHPANDRLGVSVRPSLPAAAAPTPAPALAKTKPAAKKLKQQSAKQKRPRRH